MASHHIKYHFPTPALACKASNALSRKYPEILQIKDKDPYVVCIKKSDALHECLAFQVMDHFGGCETCLA